MSDLPSASFRRLLPWILVGLLALAVAGLAVRQNLLQAERDSLRAERRFAEIATALAQSRLGERSLLAEGMINQLSRQLRRAEDLARLRVVVLQPPSGGPAGARAIVVWDPAQQAGWLTTENLPALGEREDYRIWIESQARTDPVSGGIFHPRGTDRPVRNFRPEQPVEFPVSFFVTREPQGGDLREHGPILLSGK